jgi:hypothetical protein
VEAICFLIACALAMPGPDAGTREAIARAAAEHGIDPNVALAIAERESRFNPKARASKTMRGMFQMSGGLRRQYGIGDTDDPYGQAKGWGAFFKDNKGEMARVLGRPPTDAEGYLGHHFGGVRAARMMKMDPATPIDQVFTSQERRQNPHFDKAGTVGALNASVLSDIGERAGRYGTAPDYSEAGSPAMGPAPDFSPAAVPADTLQPSVQQAAGAPDFSNFGIPA